MGVAKYLFKQKSIIVTGGATGIGAAIVRAFADAQANVFSLDLPAAHKTSSSTSNVTRADCDVTNVAALTATVAAIGEEHGLDVLVCNAGVWSDASVDDATEAARSKPLSALVVWTRRSGAPAAAIAAALSPETPVAEARAALTAVGAGSSLARSSSTKTPSADVLANDAEKLLSLVPPAAVDAGRLYAMAAELCESGAELTDLNSQHTALAAQAERGPGFPTARDIDQARAEREQNAKTRDSAKLVPVRGCRARVQFHDCCSVLHRLPGLCAGP